MTAGLGRATLKFAACRYVRSRCDLSPLGRLLLEELIDRYNAMRGCAWPSRTFLGARLGRGPTQIGEAIAEIQRAGLVQIGKSRRPTPCGHRHNLYVIDLERLAAADPERCGQGAMDDELAATTNSMSTVTTGICNPASDHGKTGESTTGKPASNGLENKLKTGARERARETRRSAPPSPAVMAGYADRREEEQRQPRRDGTTDSGPVALGDILANMPSALQDALSGLGRRLSGLPQSRGTITEVDDVAPGPVLYASAMASAVAIDPSC